MRERDPVPEDEHRRRLLDLCADFARQGPYGHPLTPPAFPIDDHDLEQLFDGLDADIITLKPKGKFNTQDRPTADGHWSLLSFYRPQTILNGEYLPQLAGYVDLIRRLGYPSERVLFEPGDRCHRLDHAVLDDTGRIVIAGEAKVDPSQPRDLIERMLAGYADSPPGPETRPPGKGRQYEAWKLAVALWGIGPSFLWLTAPGVRATFRVGLHPLTLEELPDLPSAAALGLEHQPPRRLTPHDYRSGSARA